MVFKTEERLTEYKAFFEPQLDDMAISRNISMGIKEIAARVELVKREKEAVEKAIRACNLMDLIIMTRKSEILFYLRLFSLSF